MRQPVLSFALTTTTTTEPPATEPPTLYDAPPPSNELSSLYGAPLSFYENAEPPPGLYGGNTVIPILAFRNDFFLTKLNDSEKIIIP